MCPKIFLDAGFRDFAYVARDPATGKHKCHVFRCHGNMRIRVLNCLRLAADLSLLGILVQSLGPRYQIECFPCVTVLKLG